ncbi:MAG: methyltransferase domain-containing protein [Candidatus Daviesbacteria bacterium]|nr:MAG: methyltransferase domain-containing protein [Candidatus Daviesbacteria bacterium]
MGFIQSYIKFLASKIEDDIEKHVAEFLPRGKNLTYLDCGCDNGSKTISRAKIISTNEILGFENISERANLAREKGIKVYNSDLNERWPLGDSSVDCITATEVVEHLVNLDNFFSESQRVLKKGGKIIISTENLAAYHNIMALILGNQPYTGPYLSKVYPIGHRPSAKFYQHTLPMDPHINVMTFKSLIQLLRNYRFKIIYKKGIGFYPLFSPISDFFSGIDYLHASYAMVMAQK